MSFDLYFFKRPADGNLETMLEEAEAAAPATEFSTDDRDRWGRIVPAVKAIAPEMEELVSDDEWMLDDGVAVQLSMTPDGLSLSTPYWFSGDAADEVVERLRRIVVAIENASGLVAFDPQAGELFLDGGVEAAPDAFEWGAQVVQDVVANSETLVTIEPEPGQPEPKSRRRFWRR